MAAGRARATQTEGPQIPPPHYDPGEPGRIQGIHLNQANLVDVSLLFRFTQAWEFHESWRVVSSTRLCTKSSSISPRCGRLRLAQQFTAGITGNGNVVRERTAEGGFQTSTLSIVRFTDFVASANLPSDESLGYWQSSANADLDEIHRLRASRAIRKIQRTLDAVEALQYVTSCKSQDHRAAVGAGRRRGGFQESIN